MLKTLKPLIFFIGTLVVVNFYLAEKVLKVSSEDKTYWFLSNFSIANGFISSLIFFYFTKSILFPGLAKGLVRGFSVLSNFILLNLAVGVGIAVISGCLPGKVKETAIFIPSLFFLFQLLVLVDSVIFSIFRYHINSLVINVVTAEGAEDSVIIGDKTVKTFMFYCLFLILLEDMLLIVLSKSWVSSKQLLVFGILLVISEKGMYTYGAVKGIPFLVEGEKIFPFYYPFSKKRYLLRLFSKIPRETLLKYPKEPLVFSKTDSYNILFIIIDGFRFDGLTEEIMPNLWLFSRRGLTFTNHYSGGNNTKFGLFSLLYGLCGSYWENVFRKGISPVLVDTLVERNYDFFVFSSTRLSFPDFRITAFSRVSNFIIDSFETPNICERDKIISTKFIEALLDRRRPFFGFLYFNSTHQPFFYPEGFERFKPSSRERLNYFVDISPKNTENLKNRYWNALYYTDFLIGNILKVLEDEGFLRDTLIFITGDHGEEFYETGYFGHTSGFSDYQVKVPLVVYHPLKAPGIIHYVTSHYDIVATVMEALGCVSSYTCYCQGGSLFSETLERFFLVLGWNSFAIPGKDMTIVCQFRGFKRGQVEVFPSHLTIKEEQVEATLKKALKFLRDF